MAGRQRRVRHFAGIIAAGLVIAFTVRATIGDDSTDKPPLVNKYVAGTSVGGRPIDCEVYGNGPDVLMVIATIHGSEPAGTPLMGAFAKWLVAHPAELAGRTVVIVPVANPDGFAANERFNAHGVDLNRNFPASNWGVPQEPGGPDSTKAQTSTGGDTFAHGRSFKPGETPLSEPESRTLMQLICRYYPNRIISIHQPIGCIDYDGPAERLAAAIAAKCPLPVKQVGSRPGSLGSFVGNSLQRPIITWELPEDAGMDGEALWKTYGEALVAALRFENATQGNNGEF